MSEKFRTRIAILILSVSAAFLTIAGDYFLYRNTIQIRTGLLSETAKTRAQIIASVIDHYRKESKVSDESLVNTVTEVLGQSIQSSSGFGKTGEFILARKNGDNIEFILSQRGNNPVLLPIDGSLAVPARLAVTSQKSGIIEGKDLRGKNVIAAYAPVGTLDLGVVVKMELSEIRDQYFSIGVITVFLSALLVLIGSFFILHTGRMANVRLAQSNIDLTEENRKRKCSEEKLQKTGNELLSINEEMTATLEELEASNAQLIASQVELEENLALLHDNENMLTTSLNDKEILLRELYHRTKNNMQVICGLLHLQAVNANDDIKDILRQTESRIQSMALVHKLLYQSKNLSELQFDEYIRELTVSVQEYQKIIDASVKVNLSLEKISVAIETAIPCGLVLNELLSNSYKHAFKDSTKKTINIHLAKQDNNFVIEYSDTGIGVPENFDLRKTTSLGCQLIFMIAEGQMRGTVNYYSDNGLHWKLIIPEMKYN